jgi:hypothetical protein
MWHQQCFGRGVDDEPFASTMSMTIASSMAHDKALAI